MPYLNQPPSLQQIVANKIAGLVSQELHFPDEVSVIAKMIPNPFIMTTLYKILSELPKLELASLYIRMHELPEWFQLSEEYKKEYQNEFNISLGLNLNAHSSRAHVHDFNKMVVGLLTSSDTNWYNGLYREIISKTSPTSDEYQDPLKIIDMNFRKLKICKPHQFAIMATYGFTLRLERMINNLNNVEHVKRLLFLKPSWSYEPSICTAALACGHLQTFKYLCEATRKYLKEEQDIISLYWLAFDRGHINIILYLHNTFVAIQKIPSSDYCRRPMFLNLIKNGNIQGIKFIIEKLSPIHKTSLLTGEHNESALFLAVKHQHYTIIKLLCEHMQPHELQGALKEIDYRVFRYAYDVEMLSTLYYMLDENYRSDALLSYGHRLITNATNIDSRNNLEFIFANISETNVQSICAEFLTSAIIQNSVDIVKCLWENTNKESQIAFIESKDFTHLYTAAENSRYENIKFILNEYKQLGAAHNVLQEVIAEIRFIAPDTIDDNDYLPEGLLDNDLMDIRKLSL